MKQLFFICTILLLCLHVNAQEFSINNIKKLSTDMDARVNFARKDQNGKTCAIIKIVTPLTGFSFDTGTLSVQYVVEKTGEIWVYVQPGVKKITIAHQTLGVVREWDIPIKIEEACSYALTLNAPTESGPAPKIENPQRLQLYKLRRNEILQIGECMLAFKSDGAHFVCLTSDTLLKKDYLIFDGAKRVVADEIGTGYLDPCDYDKSIFCYKDDGQWTFFIEGKTYSGYYGKWASTSGGWESYNMSWSQKEIYDVYNESAKKWESYYRGNPYTSKYSTYTSDWYNDKFKSDTVVSINKNYKVFSTEFGTITYNGVKRRIISNQAFNSDWRQSICILEDGRCYVGYFQKNKDPRRFIFEKNGAKELHKGEFINFRTNEIESSNEDYGIFTQSVYSIKSSYMKKQLRVLQDATGRHTLETCALYNYVLVDNKEYGSESAIFIRYDEQQNEFQWIALEGKELVLYRYRL